MIEELIHTITHQLELKEFAAIPEYARVLSDWKRLLKEME